MQRTVEQTTGVPIDHYAVINFDGFRSIVDALGGVEVCSPEPLRDRESGLDIPAGTTRLDGDQALSYVRARKIGDGSDTARIERQQAFLVLHGAGGDEHGAADPPGPPHRRARRRHQVADHRPRPRRA